jgi:hypothetical protein
MGWARVSDLGWGSGPKLHGMQEVRGSKEPLAEQPQVALEHRNRIERAKGCW